MKGCCPEKGVCLERSNGGKGRGHREGTGGRGQAEPGEEELRTKSILFFMYKVTFVFLL